MGEKDGKSKSSNAKTVVTLAEGMFYLILMVPFPWMRHYVKDGITAQIKMKPQLARQACQKETSLSAFSTMMPHFGKNIKAVLLWQTLFWSPCMVSLNYHFT